MVKKIVSLIISKIKKEAFHFDTEMKSLDVISLFMNRFIWLIRGICSCKCTSFISIGPKVIIKCIRKLQVGKNVSIGRAVYLDCLSKKGIILGNNVSIGMQTTIICTGHVSSLGLGVVVGNNVGLGTHGFWGAAGGITVGDDTIFGNFVSLHSENHNYKNLDIPIRLQGVSHQGIIIGKNCWIGAKVTILDGVTIEDGCIIAAGALLIAGRYERNSIYGGVPAKFLKKRE